MLSFLAVTALSGCMAAVDDAVHDQDEGDIAVSEDPVAAAGSGGSGISPGLTRPRPTCVTVGAWGSLFRSFDAGLTWVSAPTPDLGKRSTAWLQNVITTSATTFWAVGDDGVILRSTTSGGSWTEMPWPGTSPWALDIRGIATDGGTRMVVAGRPDVPYFSSDAGQTWTKSDWAWEGGYTEGVNSVVFSGGRFIAVGDAGRIGISDDGGAHWTKIVPRTLSQFNLNKVISLGNGRLVATGGGSLNPYELEDPHSIWVSNDNGTTWSPGQFVRTCLFGIAADNSGHLVGVSARGSYQPSSNDFGSTWISTDIHTTTNSRLLGAVAWHQRTNAWIQVGREGPVFRSTDYGQTWSRTGPVPMWDGDGVGLIDVACSR